MIERINKLKKFIETIRGSFVGSVTVYTYGSCYHFYLILKHVYPHAKPFTDVSGHVVTKLFGKYWDVTGEVEGNYVPLDMEEAERLKDCKFIRI